MSFSVTPSEIVASTHATRKTGLMCLEHITTLSPDDMREVLGFCIVDEDYLRRCKTYFLLSTSPALQKTVNNDAFLSGVYQFARNFPRPHGITCPNLRLERHGYDSALRVFEMIDVAPDGRLY